MTIKKQEIPAKSNLVGRVIWIDAVRGLAILLVVFGHV